MDNAKKHFDEGDRLYYLGRYEEAIKEYDKVIAIDPNFKEGHDGKGAALYYLGRYEEAIKEFDKALAIDPNDEIARHAKESALKKLKGLKK